MDATENGRIRAFPVSTTEIIGRHLVRSPVLTALYVRLPHADGDAWRRCEELFCSLLRSMPRVPAMSMEEAEAVLGDAAAASDDLIVQEIGLLEARPGDRTLAAFWRRLHDAEDDPVLRRAGLYLAALAARLLRLEPAAEQAAAS
jgi:hypothetical protein